MFRRGVRVVPHQPGHLLETKAKRVNRGWISLDAMLGIGEKQFARNAPAVRLKKYTMGTTSNFYPIYRTPVDCSKASKK